ncbi:hypothetical protein UCREL1_717 [Eutypa lata UCREL1]|uniref:Cyanovirin-N domain-containing protein n=1 Tax=Eutypa lata (strain UCR-EL1) TaxID=1287681 RepID=M7TQR4_EUTLA|nr:hypothetical protein UCREL1_717 [Eutypa lata UCREL1]
MMYSFRTGVFLALLSLLCLVAGHALGDACHDASLLMGETLEATCAYEGGQRCTRLRLDSCFMNDFGMLKGQKEGSYSQTCSGCELNGSMLSCRCKVGGTDLSYTSSIDIRFEFNLLDPDLELYAHYRLASSDAALSILGTIKLA